MYRPLDDPDFEKVQNFIVKVDPRNKKELFGHLSKSFKGMMKAGAYKTADVMIPKDHKLERFK